jgi:hypothetical protein
VREACELRGRSVERLCHGFALELAGDHPGLDGLDLALLAQPGLAAAAHKTTTVDLR